MKKKIAILALGAMACFLTAQEARAALVAGPSASASLDWDSFQMRLIDVTGSGAPAVAASGQNDWSYALAGVSSAQDAAADWTSGTLAEAWGSYARAMTDAGEISSFASLNFTGNDHAYATSQRSADFLVSGTGLLVVQADYSWQVQLDGASGLQYAGAGVDIILADENYRHTGEGAASGSLYSGGGSIFDEESGIVVAALFVTDGMTVHMDASSYAEANAAAPVPLPAALWFFGSGCAGLLAARGKRRS